MKEFPRQPKPRYWASRERAWIQKLRDWSRALPLAPRPSAKKDALWSWQREQTRLADRFHAEVRPAEDPSLCAYCDGPLEETSAATIDHFIPEALCPKLGVFWENLFPACSYCNSSCKKDQWSPDLLRPDRDPVESYFDFDPETGCLAPIPGASEEIRRKVEETIKIFGLNEGSRPRARCRRWREMNNSWEMIDLESLQESILQGPYRFVAERLRDAKLG